MKSRFAFLSCFILISALAGLAQQRLYPVRGTMLVERTPSEEDHYYFVLEKPFEYKLTLGFPRSDQAQFIRDTNAPVIVLWLRVESLSQQPFRIDAEKFAATGPDGRPLTRLTADDAFDRILEGKGLTEKAATKGLRTITLGKAASKRSEKDDRDEAVRFAFQSGDVAPLGLRQGLIYFEGPSDKTFTFNVSLGDLVARPFAFTNVKPKR